MPCRPRTSTLTWARCCCTSRPPSNQATGKRLERMRFILRRAGFFLVTLWAAVTLNFFLPRMMPGNPALAMVAKFHGRLSGQALTSLENLFGVNTDTSLFVQYLHYLGDIATGNFGTSLYFYPASVSSVVRAALPWTLGLVGVTTILAFVLGTGVGI